MTRPVVFLDCDGVVNYFGGGMEWNNHPNAPYASDPACIDRLRRLVEALDAEVVISSTWRILNEREDFGRLIGPWIIDRIPEAWRTRRQRMRSAEGEPDLRGNQIADWLAENGPRPYVILDDDSDMLPGQPFVRTSGYVGLTDADVDRAIEIVRAQVSP